jgi:dihydrofolate synthase/folylpolyglutamate synthase
MTYAEAIDYLYGLEATRGWDLKLERVRAALELLGFPERRFPSVLIAGTNGKGATAAIVHSILQAGGFRVGLYTSPHLVSFTERIRIGLDEIARERVTHGVVRLRRLVEDAGIPLTFFEMSTVLAFDEFARDRVDAAVLEVGLGGRLDATNVVEPVASAVVSIGRDHEAFLGDTLDSIAREKAGVMRAGRAVVLGPALAEEARLALLEEAARIGARVVEADPSDPATEAVALRGAHMRRNAAVALALLDELGAACPHLAVDAATRRAGLAGVRWPGRLEIVHQRPLVVVDGAHNREGVAALVEGLPAVFGTRRPRLLFAVLADKPWADMAAALRPHVASVTVTEAGGKRGVPAGELAGAFGPDLPVAIDPDPVRALADLLARDRETPVLVAGSLFLVGAVYAAVLGRHHLDSVFEPLPEIAA